MSDREFAQMVQQYERLVYTICYQFTKDHHIAEDLAQEAFLAAYRHKDTCPQDNLKPWIARIATNKAKDHLKSAYHRRVYATEAGDMEDSRQVLFIREDQPEELAIEREAVNRIEGDIRALREPYKQVSILYFLEEKTVEEIARALERPPKTVHTQLYRARGMLQEKLKGGMRDEPVPRQRTSHR